ncbi:MAG: hypothetical protein Q9193_001442 [Seirophora villosa]
MVEPAILPSINAGAAALAVACAKAISTIHAIGQRNEGPDLLISSIAQELALVQCVWDFVQTLLDQRRSHNDLDHELLLRLDENILYGRRIVQILNDELSSCATLSSSTAEYSFRRRTRITRNEKRWRRHQDRIRGQMLSTNLLISILRPSDSARPSNLAGEGFPIMLDSDSSPTNRICSNARVEAAEIDGANCHEMSTEKASQPNELHAQSKIRPAPSGKAAVLEHPQPPAGAEISIPDQASAVSQHASMPVHLSPKLSLSTRLEDMDHRGKGLGGCVQGDPVSATEYIVSGYDKATTTTEIDGNSLNEPTDVTGVVIGAGSTEEHATLQERALGEGVQLQVGCHEMLAAAGKQGGLESALLYACQHGAVQMVNGLLTAGVNVHSCVKHGNSLGLGPTAIHIAVMHRQHEVVTALLRYGALPNGHDHRSQRPLHHAAENGDSVITALLLEHGAKPGYCDKHGTQALHNACHIGSLEVARLLLNEGASLEATDDKGRRPLHFLAKFVDDSHFAAFLVDLGCNLHAKTTRGLTPVQLACATGNCGVLRVLLSHGASTDFEEWCAMPLALAVAEGHQSAARLLLESGAEVHHRCPATHKSIIHLAVESARSHQMTNRPIGSQMIDLLCKYGAVVNAQDTAGNTPLHLAVSAVSINGSSKGQQSMVRCLLSHRARADIPNHEGLYPLAIASRNPELLVFRLVLAVSIQKLPDKHLARISREVQRQKMPAHHSKSKEMSSLLSNALLARALQV